MALKKSWLVLFALAFAQQSQAQPSGWDRATPGPGAANALAAWPPEESQRMRRTQLRFCANLRLATRGAGFPFADDAACVARQEALLDRLCMPDGESRRRRGAACHSVVERDMRDGLNRLRHSSGGPELSSRRERAARPPSRDRADGPPPTLTTEILPLPPQPGPTRGAEASAAEVFARAQAAIWVVLVEASPGVRGGAQGGAQGSAVAIGPRHALTNCHVVRRGSGITLIRGETRLRAALIHADPTGDRCVVQTERPGLQPIRGLRSSRELQVGERAYAIGAPHGLALTLTEGIVSAVRSQGGVALVQSTAPVSFGSSGGGLFDARGNLIGITTFGVGQQGGLNFSIAPDGFWQVPPLRARR